MRAPYRTVAAIALSALWSGAPSAQTAQHVCDREHKTRVQATACAKAAESPTALRQYAWNTRIIHNIEMREFYRTPEQAAQRAAEAKEKPAPVPVAASR